MELINLEKGGKISLEKTNPGVTKYVAGLGWDVQAVRGSQAFDLDASVLLLTGGKMVNPSKNTIYYNNLKSVDGAVVHQGDNLTGAGDGPDEKINVDLSKIAPEIDRLVFVVNIYQAQARSQNFGQVSSAFVNLVDEVSGNEVVRYDLSEDFSGSTSVEVANIYRHNGEWKFEAAGRGAAEGLNEVIARYQ